MLFECVGIEQCNDAFAYRQAAARVLRRNRLFAALTQRQQTASLQFLYFSLPGHPDGSMQGRSGRILERRQAFFEVGFHRLDLICATDQRSLQRLFQIEPRCRIGVPGDFEKMLRGANGIG